MVSQLTGRLFPLLVPKAARHGVRGEDNPSILPLEWLSGKMKELAAF
jgi:hypothetical protein